VYKFNVALQARKDRIEELKELVAIEENAAEKKKIKAALKALLLTPPPSEEDYKRQAVLELAGTDDADLVSFV
jgi:hypothetical protein